MADDKSRVAMVMKSSRRSVAIGGEKAKEQWFSSNGGGGC
jgi:hypothetical protein